MSSAREGGAAVVGVLQFQCKKAGLQESSQMPARNRMALLFQRNARASFLPVVWFPPESLLKSKLGRSVHDGFRPCWIKRVVESWSLGISVPTHIRNRIVLQTRNTLQYFKR